MTDETEKKKSGCVKWLGCGCLVLVLVAAGLGISGWLMAKKLSAPSEAHAGHFIPEDTSGWAQMNLQKPDEGMSDLHRYIMAEIQRSQPEQEGLAGMLQGLFNTSPEGKPSPIGPKITGWLETQEGHTPPVGALVVDLNTMNKLTATALQFTFSTLMAAEAVERDVDGISLYENPNGYSYLSHKGFIVLSQNAEILEAAARQFQSNEQQDWPTIDSFINDQDIRFEWTGDFEHFNTFTTDLLGIANPKDGDFESPSKGLEKIDLDADILSADAISFTIQAQAATADDARRIQLDLEEHAAELQQKLSPLNLSFDYSGEAKGTTASISANLSGLKEWISGRISQMFSVPETGREATNKPE